MKYTNKARIAAVVLTGLLGLSGCAGKSYDLAYVPNSSVSSYRIVNTQDEVPVAKPFAADLCVANEDITGSRPIAFGDETGAALFDLSDHNILYAKNIHSQLVPASLTKIMSALVILKYGTPDTLLTASENVKLTEPGAQVCGIKAGDQLTLDQLLHLMLVNSANDAAVMAAEGVAGSLDEFAAMMNREAKAIGATNSNFVNPHGLPDEDHYTTVYDMYLILNEVMKYDDFNQIIQLETYTTSYTTAGGAAWELSVNTTNLYLRGEQQAPERVTVLGGKTGTTNAAGHCLALIAKDTAGKSYISVIMRSDSRDELYGQMSELLSQIVN